MSFMHCMGNASLNQTREYVMDKKQIIAKIAGIKKAGKTLQSNIIDVEIAAMEHAKAHGDNTLLTRLVQALPQGVRVKALVKHIVDHTPYKYDDKLNVFVKPKKTAKTFLIEEARKVPFYEYSTETVVELDWDKLYQFDAYLKSEAKMEEKEATKIKGDKAKALARKAILQAAKSQLAKLEK